MGLRRGTLWQTILSRTERAIRSGALQPVETEPAIVVDGGVGFSVRVASSLAQKNAEKKRQAEKAKRTDKPVNPFLPYDEELFVAVVSDTHVALLNKFNVIDDHLLIVTRAFEDQESLLTPQDFEALWSCMAEYEALGFYNGGLVAGASQPHKHLQIVPLPLASEGPAIPVEPLLASARFDGPIGSTPSLPFLHAIVRLDPSVAKRPLEAARITHDRYHALIASVGLKAINVGGEVRQSGPYNLLFTREWMLMVPRSREFFRSVSINALGFAGSLFVRNEQQLETIRNYGPMAVLRHVAIATT